MMERKRLNSTEQNALMSLCAAFNAIGDAAALENRLKSLPRGWQMIRSCDGQIAKMIELIAESMPTEQLMSFYRNRKTLTYYIAVKSPAGRPYDNDGRWLSYDALDTILEAVQDHCITCMKNPQEQRKCRLAKALDELPLKKADNSEYVNGCRYIKGLF